jgi:hypothetical protein
MKTSNILTLGILAVIGASIVIYFRKNKLQVVNNTEIDKKIDEAVKEIASINQASQDIKLEAISQEAQIKLEAENKEAENFLQAVILSKKIADLRAQRIGKTPKLGNATVISGGSILRDLQIKSIEKEMNILGYMSLPNGEVQQI